MQPEEKTGRFFGTEKAAVSRLGYAGFQTLSRG
jgi:hypothetical protein